MSNPDYTTLPQQRFVEAGSDNQVHYIVGERTACGRDTGDFDEGSETTTEPATCQRCLSLARIFGAAAITQQRVQAAGQQITFSGRDVISELALSCGWRTVIHRMGSDAQVNIQRAHGTGDVAATVQQAARGTGATVTGDSSMAHICGNARQVNDTIVGLLALVADDGAPRTVGRGPLTPVSRDVTLDGKAFHKAIEDHFKVTLQIYCSDDLADPDASVIVNFDWKDTAPVMLELGLIRSIAEKAGMAASHSGSRLRLIGRVNAMIATLRAILDSVKS